MWLEEGLVFKYLILTKLLKGRGDCEVQDGESWGSEYGCQRVTVVRVTGWRSGQKLPRALSIVWFDILGKPAQFLAFASEESPGNPSYRSLPERKYGMQAWCLGILWKCSYLVVPDNVLPRCVLLPKARNLWIKQLWWHQLETRAVLVSVRLGC